MDDFSLQEPISVVIVGHVDHGKSTFIGRFLFDTDNLTTERLAELKETSQKKGEMLDFAHVMDQFREEREQNITIDTAQTFFQIKGYPYVFVDAPGHKEYLKNMITGATNAENAILLIDIKEGIKEQTDTHVRILKLLGITRIAVLVNKMDMVGYAETPFRALEVQIQRLLESRGMKAHDVIPVSASQGDNVAAVSDRMPWHAGPTALQFLEFLQSIPVPVTREQELRFPVQLVHSVKKVPYAMGRVEKGALKKGEELEVFPSGGKTRIEEIIKHPKSVKLAAAGDSVALQLSSKAVVKRGDILWAGSQGLKGVDHFTTHTFWAYPKALKPEEEFYIECRAQRVKCWVRQIRDEFNSNPLPSLDGGEVALVEWVAEGPLFVEPYQPHEPFARVVMQKGGAVIGCGVVQKINGENL